MDRRYFPALDGLRGVAAIGVLGLHASIAATGHIILVPRGHLAVDFFFLLSGFVIENAYGQRSMSFGAFALQRLVRLYPMIVLGALLGLLAPAPSAVLFLLQLLCVPDIGGDLMFPLNNAMWSMFYELAVNVVFFIVLRRLSSPVLVVVVLASAVGLMLSGWHEHTLSVGSTPATLMGGLPRVSFSFGIGMLLCRRSERLTAFPPVSWLVVATLLIALLCLPNLPRNNLPTEVLLLFVALPALMAISIRARVPERHVPLCTFLGLLSYPLYLVHLPILAFASTNRWMASRSGQIGTVAVVLAVALAATWLFDVPVRAWIARQFRRDTRLAVRSR